MATEQGKIATALAKAQGEFTQVAKQKTAVVKTKSGGEYRYNYADFADVLRMAIPILSRNGLAFTQGFKRVQAGADTKLCLASKLIHAESGETIESDGISIPETILPQEFGSYLTYWRRYDGCSLLGIQPDDDEDAVRASQAAKKATGQDKFEKQGRTITPQQQKAFWQAVKAGGKTEDQVRAYLKSLKIASTEEIPKTDLDMAIKWACGISNDLTKIVTDSIAVAHNFPKLFAMAKEKGIPEDDVRQIGHEIYHVNSLKDLTKDQFQQLMEHVEQMSA